MPFPKKFAVLLRTNLQGNGKIFQGTQRYFRQQIKIFLPQHFLFFKTFENLNIFRIKISRSKIIQLAFLPG